MLRIASPLAERRGLPCAQSAGKPPLYHCIARHAAELRAADRLERPVEKQAIVSPACQYGR